MDHAVLASLTAMRPILAAVAVTYVAISFMYLAGGEITLKGFLGKTVRLFVVVQFIINAANYNQYVRDLFFDGLPSAFATTFMDTPATISSAQQFDKASGEVDNLVATALQKNSAWSTSALANSIAIWIADIGIKCMIAVWAFVWSLGRFLLAVVLGFGPWLLVFELFDRTRGFVDHWIGTLVGLVVYQLAGAITLQIVMTGAFSLLTSIHTAAVNVSVDDFVGMIVQVCYFFAMGALTMLALPFICSVGSGAAAGNAVAMTASAGLIGRGMSSLSNSVRSLRAQMRRSA